MDQSGESRTSTLAKLDPDLVGSHLDSVNTLFGDSTECVSVVTPTSMFLSELGTPQTMKQSLSSLESSGSLQGSLDFIQLLKVQYFVIFASKRELTRYSLKTSL